MAETFTSFKLQDAQGKEHKLSEFSDKVVLVVNVASRCGFTKQYTELEQIYQKYNSQGFMIAAVPSNQFGAQEPGTNEEIQKFCKLNYGVTFPVYAKADVNGPEALPLYKWLKENDQNKAGKNAEDIKWNFTKFLVGKNGEVVRRYESKVTPLEISNDIEKALKVDSPKIKVTADKKLKPVAPSAH